MPNMPGDDTNYLDVVSVNEQRIVTLTSTSGQYKATGYWSADQPLEAGNHLIIINRDATAISVQRMSDGVRFSLVFDVD